MYNFDKDSNDGNFLGYPDGMTIDSNDTLWIAMWDGWCVYNVDPVQKVIVAKYDIPCQRVTSCAFGGKNLDYTSQVQTAGCALDDEGEEKWLREQVCVCARTFLFINFLIASCTLLMLT